MKKQDNQLVTDVEKLAKDSIVAEASERVWDRFSKAMSQLDEASQVLLSDFFDGADIEELSRRTGLALDEVDAWIRKARKELVENMRTQTQVRQ